MRSRLDIIQTLRQQGASPSRIWTLLQLRRALSGCDSVLDIGCGSDSALSIFGLETLVGFEGYGPSVEAARAKRTHQEIIMGKVQNLASHFATNQFEACIAIDVIEHMTKQEGLQMLSSMERIASKRSIILTPNGFLPQGHTDKADLQVHLSGWEPAEMGRLGYRVVGVLGPKRLRGEYHRLLHSPDWFWGTASLVCQIICSNWAPSTATAILCVKEKVQP